VCREKGKQGSRVRNAAAWEAGKGGGGFQTLPVLGGKNPSTMRQESGLVRL